MKTTTKIASARLLACLAGLAAAGSVSGQTFSLDDNPSAPLTTTPWAGLFGAEDPYGFGFPSVGAGLVPPSPSLIVGPFIDSTPLLPGPSGVPAQDVFVPTEAYLDAISANHFNADDPFQDDFVISLRFSIDRATTGLPGSASLAQATRHQQPGDIFESDRFWPHPVQFVGTLVGAPFAGVLPPAGSGGGNTLYLDESRLTLTAGNGVGVLVGPGVVCPPIMPGRHDNVDAFNEYPTGRLDMDNDNVTDFSYYFSVPPAEGFINGLSPSAIYDIPPGQVFFPLGGPPFATAAQIGLEPFGGDFENNIDSLVVWDLGDRHGPSWNGPGAEPKRDFALFTLSPGSQALNVLGLTPGTVFFTDFDGAFAVFCFGSDLALDSPFGEFYANVDALEVKQIPPQDCVGDLDGDGDTDQADLGILLGAYGSTGDGDLDGDGDTDQADLGILLGDYGCGT